MIQGLTFDIIWNDVSTVGLTSERTSTFAVHMLKILYQEQVSKIEYKVPAVSQ